MKEAEVEGLWLLAGVTSQKMWVALQVGKGKEIDSPPEPLEGMQSCQQLDSSPVGLILDF